MKKTHTKQKKEKKNEKKSVASDIIFENKFSLQYHKVRH